MLYLSITLPLMHVANGIELSQWDASNLLGSEAFRGGLSTAAIGFGLHLCVSIAWGIVFGFRVLADFVGALPRAALGLDLRRRRHAGYGLRRRAARSRIASDAVAGRLAE